MIIDTSRFGGIEVDDQRFLNFPKGLLGFPDDREYALIQTGENSAFYWMQAVHRPELAFVVCDPRMFVADFRILIKPVIGRWRTVRSFVPGPGQISSQLKKHANTGGSTMFCTAHCHRFAASVLTI